MSMSSDFDEFELANNAFNLFTLAERRAALVEFANLKYSLVDARFFEAVHRVIVKHKTALAAPDGPEEAR